jgi:hypothetical protein
MPQKIEFCSYILWQGLPRHATELRHGVSPLESNVSHFPSLHISRRWTANASSAAPGRQDSEL